jgi:MFS family permease
MLAKPNRLQGNITKLYLMHFFSNAQFHLVVYTLFLLSKGFSMQQFFLIESAYFLVALLMEIPTGVFSDKISRKWSLVIASLIGIPIVPTIILSDSFLVILIAMSVGGISASFVSGTDVAMLYDTLKALDREHEFKKIIGRCSWYGSISMALAGIGGGLLAQFDMAYAWWAYFAAGLVAMMVQITLVEPPFTRASKDEESYLQHLGQSLKLSFAGDAAYYVVYGAAIWLFFSLGFWLWQPYLERTALPIAYFGLFYAATNFVSGFISRQAHKIEGRLGIRASLLLIPMSLALAFFLESQVTSLFGFLFIFIQAVASGYFSPVLEDYTNTRIPSAKRATVLSIKNMLFSLLFMLLSPLLGGFIDVYALPAGLLLLALALTILGIALFAFYRRQAKPVTAATRGTSSTLDLD